LIFNEHITNIFVRDVPDSKCAIRPEPEPEPDSTKVASQA